MNSHPFKVDADFILKVRDRKPAADIQQAQRNAMFLSFLKNTRMMFGFGAAHPYPGCDLFDYAEKHKFCTLEDMMFTSENKGKPTHAAVNEYLKKYNFNHFAYEDFISKWKQIEMLQIKNQLFQHRHNFIVKIFELCPMLLTLSCFMKRSINYIKYYFHAAFQLLKSKGAIEGSSVVVKKITQKIKERFRPALQPVLDIPEASIVHTAQESRNARTLVPH